MQPSNNGGLMELTRKSRKALALLGINDRVIVMPREYACCLFLILTVGRDWLVRGSLDWRIFIGNLKGSKP
jgi:hypothetical protein